MTTSLAKPDAVTTFDILRVPARIEILRLVREHGVPMSREELATHVAVWADDSSTGDGTSAVRRWIVKLQHVHLPKLVDVGILDYDTDAGTITAVHEERLDSLLETGQETLAALQVSQSPPL